MERARCLFAVGACSTTVSFAAAAVAAEPTQQEIEAWLDSRGLPAADASVDPRAPEEAPPPPPRHRGLVVQSSLGALGHFGPLRNVSPPSPWFHLQVGFEPWRWLMVLAEGDAAFSTTSWARRPPEARSYALLSAGAGLRFTVAPTERLGLYLQGTIGGAAASDDALGPYGYRDTTDVSPYYGGLLGLEWYQGNPHLGLGLTGGVRNYDQLLHRTRSSETALAWVGAASLRYAF